MPHVAATTQLLVDTLIDRTYGRVAAVSSFGTESAVLLHLIASVAPETPVIFLDTGKLFAETLAYRDTLIARLGLTDVRTILPDAPTLDDADPDGTLWQRDPDVCCWHRKVEPLDLALDGFDAWINGRKRFHGQARAALKQVEVAADWRTKINPLAGWSAADIIAYFQAHDLPRHPLEPRGYRSIGCAPCTAPVSSDQPARAGRWAGQAKTECGIHAPRPREAPEKEAA